MARHKVDLIFCNGGSPLTTQIATEEGWYVGARSDKPFSKKSNHPYTFIDWNFRKPDWDQHIRLISQFSPKYCTAPDIYSEADMPTVRRQVEQLSQYSEYVIVVPKVPNIIEEIVTWKGSLLGYSVPNKYGSAENVPEWEFAQYPIHLLGGGPKRQFDLAHMMNVISLDCKSHLKAASFGRYYERGFKDIDLGGVLNYYEAFRRSCKNIISSWRETFDVNT